jgi:hypothetical protein
MKFAQEMHERAMRKLENFKILELSDVKGEIVKASNLGKFEVFVNIDHPETIDWLRDNDCYVEATDGGYLIRW